MQCQMALNVMAKKMNPVERDTEWWEEGYFSNLV